MVAYHYPPEGGSSGVLRTFKFSKFLPQYNWSPHILTLKESLYPQRDYGLAKDIPATVRVHRTFALDTAKHLSVRGRYLGALAVPDRYVGWFPFGLIRGLSVIRSHNIKVLFSTSPSPTAHLIAAMLKALTGIPWVADFRDPWIEEGLHPIPGSLRYHLESKLERAVISHADQVITTTPDLSDEMRRRYPTVEKSKMQCIYNGFDEADFESLALSSTNKKFEIIHAGLVTKEYRDPAPFLKSVSALVQSGKIDRSDLKLTFLGGGSYLGSAEFHDSLAQHGLEDVVEISAARISYKETLRRLHDSAVLLVLQSTEDTRCLIPAKAFEYLRVGKPILALTTDGATEKLLKKYEDCSVANPDDQATQSDALLSFYDRWRQGGAWACAARNVMCYERAALTKELAQVFDRLAGA